MGYLRFWLALSVMFAHFGVPAGMRVLDGAVNVYCFFVLSGFVIALVLDERYAKRLGAFALQRLLRIYPGYLAALALSLAAWCWVALAWDLPRGPVAFWRSHPGTVTEGTTLALLQLMLLGHDSWGKASLAGQALLDYLLLPHAWTLSVELCFYALAPWLAKRSSWLLLALVVWTLGYRLWHPFSSPGFSPEIIFDAGFFAMGMLAWRWRRAWLGAGNVEGAALILFSALFFALPYLVNDPGGRSVLAPWMCALALPALHRVGGSLPLDRPLGEASYSLYLIHPLAGLAIAMQIRGLAEWPRAAVLLIGCTLSAFTFWALVDRPLDGWRKRLSRP